MEIEANHIQTRLDSLYCAFNRKEFIEYDPIRYVHHFTCRVEQELVGLIASSLSFGRVKQIFRAIDFFLALTDNEPLEYVRELKNKPDKRLLSFKYRFVTGADIYNLLRFAKELIEEYGSIGQFVRENHMRGQFLKLVERITERFQKVRYLIPSSPKSGCKRLFMYFRWMVRHDEVDLGFWDFMSPRELIIPLDTHILNVSKELGFTHKNTPCLNTAIEITDNLRRYSENDPVKYDWALSHIGIIRNNFSPACS